MSCGLHLVWSSGPIYSSEGTDLLFLPPSMSQWCFSACTNETPCTQHDSCMILFLMVCNIVICLWCSRHSPPVIMYDPTAPAHTCRSGWSQPLPRKTQPSLGRASEPFTLCLAFIIPVPWGSSYVGSRYTRRCFFWVGSTRMRGSHMKSGSWKLLKTELLGQRCYCIEECQLFRIFA